MNYIYCYTNKKDGHKYIGQTNNIERRKREHHSCAFNENSKQFLDLFHSKLREYGEENFTFEILEVIDSGQEATNEAEIKWIEYYKTYCGDNLGGYNMTRGGETCHTWVYPEKASAIKEAIKAGYPYEVITSIYGISPGHISNINHGKYYYDEKETYPLYNYRKDDQIAQAIDLLLNSELKMTEIAQSLNLAYSTIKKINAGTLRYDKTLKYPLRIDLRAKRAFIIKKMLEQNKTNLEIMQETGVSEETIYRINNGITYKENRKYPIRTCNDYLGSNQE